MTDKKTLRREMAERYSSLSGEYVRVSNLGIFDTLVNMPEIKNASTVFLYCSTEHEPDTIRLTNYLITAGKTVAMPVSYSGGIMQAKVISSAEELEPGKFGIPAPDEDARNVEREDVDVIIVPAMAYDTSCRRLGRGGGYYDRYLNGFNGVSIGLAREKCLLDDIPTEKFDERVDIVVTEERIIRK